MTWFACCLLCVSERASVPVPMMHVREMRMAMCQRIVRMRVAMRLLSIPSKVMCMLMMQVMLMLMHMRVRFHFMPMGVLVFFTQMQPDADAHQKRREIKQRARRIVQ